ncbi:hypothetical protein GSbR_14240 [Geobacter sp. SVR]|nr:hypothetical protein GSVR_43690 [Geobacter sp. SVR]GCF84824.1 hypothetical protein GSbR_14240 [Geobacter sp. SVR]
MFLSLIVMIFLITGCTYTGAIRDDFYAATQKESAKINLTVGVVDTSKNKNKAFIFGGGGYSVDIKLGAIANGLQSELSTIFEKVILTDGKRCSFCDLNVTYESIWKNTLINTTSGNLTFDTALKVNFTDAKNTTIHNFVATDTAMYNTPGSVHALGFITGFTLFALSPITIPAITNVIGEHAEQVLEETLKRQISQIGEKVVLEPSLKEFSVKNWSNNTPDSASQHVSSKYDDLMDAVTIIRTSSGFGSGFFISKDGLIVTNAHVVGNNGNVSVKLRDGRTLLGDVVRRTEAFDLAIVKVKGSGFTWLMIEDADEAPVGTDVITIGTPKGLEWTVTKGIVSANRKEVRGINVVQTDAAINAGNSGGPLISLSSGKVLGVNAFTLFRNQQAQGLNFAVSSKEVAKIVNSLPR